VDEQLLKIANYRRNINMDLGGSTIDGEVRFRSAPEVAAYLLRGFQIAFFSPFPNLWFTEGNKITGSAARALSAFETAFAYFCFLGLPFFTWKNRKQSALWVILFLCTAILLVYAITVPNQGSLYRFRYPYYMPVLCMGLAGWMIFGIESLLKSFQKKYTSSGY
jgi:hypothetical protein